MSDTKLNGRLCSAASFVRQGAVIADIGTDHAYLPIFLINSGIAKAAYAADINEGPLKKAEENILAAGLSGSIECRLLDGAYGLCGLGITDYAICGMGGELIAEIIGRAPHLKDECVRLILQPMSRQEHLRAYLCQHGFDILAEAYSSDSGKDYVCFLAEYSGKSASADGLDGYYLPARDAKLFGRDAMLRYYTSKYNSLKRAADGKRRSQNLLGQSGECEDCSREEQIAERVLKLINGIPKMDIPDIRKTSFQLGE